MHAALTVFFKEVIENLRDRRTVLNALITGPLIGPILFALLLGVQLRQQIEQAEKPLPIPVIGVRNAPNLIAYLRAQGLVVKPPPQGGSAQVAVREQRTSLVLVIPKRFAKAWAKGEPAGVELVYDSSRRASATPLRRLREMLRQYASITAAQRMLVRGLSPTLARPVVVERRDQATAQSRSALVFSILPYFFVLTVFLGGMYLAIDTTAGERERQSLEPLLANPVARNTILAGKLMATTAFALVSLCLSILAFSLVGRFMPMQQLNIVLQLGPYFAAITLLLMLPLTVLLAALQTLVAAFAKSYREAQTYLSLLMIIPVIPSLLLAFMPLKAATWMYLVPLLGQQLGIMTLVRGDVLSPQSIAASLLGTSVTAALAWLATAWVYRSERLAISA